MCVSSWNGDYVYHILANRAHTEVNQQKHQMKTHQPAMEGMRPWHTNWSFWAWNHRAVGVQPYISVKMSLDGFTYRLVMLIFQQLWHCLQQKYCKLLKTGFIH